MAKGDLHIMGSSSAMSVHRASRDAELVCHPQMHNGHHISAGHELMIKFRKTLAQSLLKDDEAHGGAIINPDGTFGREGIKGNHLSLHTIAGRKPAYMAPFSPDNALERYEKGALPLDPEGNPRDKVTISILEEFIDVYFDAPAMDAGVSFRKGVSAGPAVGRNMGDPYMHSAVRFMAERWEKVLEYAARSDVYGLLYEFGIYFLAKQGERLQVDRVFFDDEGNLTTKARFGPDQERMDSMGFLGSLVEDDKDLGNGNFACRHRVIAALDAALNHAVQCVVKAHDTSFRERFPITAHHTGADDLNKKIRIKDEKGNYKYKFTIGLDVVNHDRIVTEVVVAMMLDGMSRKGYKDGFVNLLWLMHHSAFAYKNPKRGEAGGGVTSDPMDVDKLLAFFPGLLSGISTVSTIGMMMGGIYLDIIHSVTGDVQGNVREYLNHERDIGLFYKGDDAFMGTNDERVADALRAALAEYKFMLIDVEEGLEFLGSAAIVDSTDRGVSFVQAPGNWHLKEMVSETGIGFMTGFHGVDFKQTKEYPGLAFLVREEVYSRSAPCVERYREIRDRTFRDVFGSPYAQAYTAMAAGERIDSQLPQNFAEADVIMQHGEPLRWGKYADDQIRPEIHAMFTRRYDQYDVDTIRHHSLRKDGTTGGLGLTAKALENMRRKHFEVAA